MYRVVHGRRSGLIGLSIFRMMSRGNVALSRTMPEKDCKSGGAEKIRHDLNSYMSDNGWLSIAS